jgi:hypothetical protein
MGFLCQNMLTNDVFFLPFGFLKDVKMTSKKLWNFWDFMKVPFLPFLRKPLKMSCKTMKS